MDSIEVLGVPVTDFDPYCLKHGEERRELFKSATLEDAGLKRSALLKYLLPKNSMIKFFVLDVLLRRVVAVSSDPAPDSAFAPSFLGRPSGQLP
jgi:hypothetical protein